MMKIEDMQENESLCRSQLGDWDIVALQDGTVDGRGYGYMYHEDDSRRCTIDDKLLMRDDGRLQEEKYLNCPGDDDSYDDNYDEFESFADWLACYQETYEECGASHSKHYDCYLYDIGCDDPNWYDCFWYGTTYGADCEGEEKSEYEKGFESGYMDGYADAVRDTNGPEPEEMDTFKL